MDTSISIQKASELMSEAQKEAAKNSCLNRCNNYKLLKLYGGAGDNYAVAKEYELSANSYMLELATFCKIKKDAEVDSSILLTIVKYVNVCNKGNIKIDNDVINKFDSILKNDYDTKLCHRYQETSRTISKNYEMFGDLDKSIKYQKILIDLYNLSSKNTVQEYLKLSELQWKKNSLMESFKNYKKSISKRIGFPLHMFGLNSEIMKSMILLVRCTTEEIFFNKLDEYVLLYPNFAKSFEYSTIKEFYSSYKSKNFLSFDIFAQKIIGPDFIIEELSNIKKTM
jgi:hypothetical protein